ncbi:unnamed protein product [Cunninghamella blakesleeana]
MKEFEETNLSNIESLIKECETTDNWTPLTNVLLNVFGDMYLLSESFLKETTSLTHCPVDKIQAQKAFHLIKTNCPPFLFKRITDRVRKLIRYFIRNKRDKITVVHLNAIIILFQCPVYVDILYPNNLLNEICEFIANISTHLQDILCQYILEEDEEKKMK